jgi:glyoxylase-like metal-dependent hydrolase (beta-lactamase superfamily II)
MSSLKVAVLPVTPLQQNCTLITDADTGHTAIIDPGGDAGQILAALDANKLNAVAIWLTHGHLDHAGGAAELKEKLDARPGRDPVEIVGPDRRDEMLLHSIAEQARMFGLTGLRNASPDRYLTEGESDCVGPHVFEVLHCPGHTPGHVVFINRAARFAQLGDVLFRGSVGRTDFPYGDHAALIDSIKTKLLPLGDDVRFVCGHGPSSSIGAERATNPFLR